MRNQSAAADQKHREMEHKLRVRTKELVDLQVIKSGCNINSTVHSAKDEVLLVYRECHDDQFTTVVPRRNPERGGPCEEMGLAGVKPGADDCHSDYPWSKYRQKNKH